MSLPWLDEAVASLRDPSSFTPSELAAELTLVWELRTRIDRFLCAQDGSFERQSLRDIETWWRDQQHRRPAPPLRSDEPARRSGETSTPMRSGR
jgi:hypothetical protein